MAGACGDSACGAPVNDGAPPYWVAPVSDGGENGIGAATFGGAARLVMGMLRLNGEKSIWAGLRHYAWESGEVLVITGLPTSN